MSNISKDSKPKNNAEYFVCLDFGSLKLKTTIINAGNLSLHAQYSHLTLLGKDLKENKRILESSINETEKALRSIFEIINSYGDTVSIRAIGTQALREAENSNSIEVLLQRYFPNTNLDIISQSDEARHLYSAIVSDLKNDKGFTLVDIGGGSVQIIQSVAETVEYELLPFGTYSLQQKYSPDDSILSNSFHLAISQVKEEIKSKKLKETKYLIVGSTCMIDFFIACSEAMDLVLESSSIENHPITVSRFQIEKMLEHLLTLPADKRDHLFPKGGYFIYGADYLLMILLEIMEAVGAKYIVPTNKNSSYGLFI